jgi:hypothetical protein
MTNGLTIVGNVVCVFIGVRSGCSEPRMGQNVVRA